MQAPLPELEGLYLSMGGTQSPVPVIPEPFLGGSAPHLRYLHLVSILFPGIPTLLLSATHLVKLNLDYIPNSGFVSPEAMAACLPTLTSLKSLSLEFEPLPSYPDLKRRSPFPPTH